jgi:6-phosphogluconolactonase (cycloisomerase 2 family)
VAADGSLQVIPGTSTFSVGRGPKGLAVDPGNHFLYVANSLDNNISIMRIDQASGALSESTGSPQPAATTPSALLMTDSGANLYAANFGSSSVSGYSVDSGTGVLTALANSPFSTSSGPIFMFLNPQLNQLFVGCQTAKSVTHFTFKASGALNSASDSTTTQSAPAGIAFTH